MPSSAGNRMIEKCSSDGSLFHIYVQTVIKKHQNLNLNDSGGKKALIWCGLWCKIVYSCQQKEHVQVK